MSLAEQVVNNCLKVTAEDNVTIFLWDHTIPLAEALASECFKKGADVLLNLYTDKYYLSYMTELSAKSLREPSIFCRALTESSTVEIWAGSPVDPNLLKAVPPEKTSACDEGEMKAHFPLSRQRKIRSLDIGLAAVTKPRAKSYGFSYPTWKRLVSMACSVDYMDLRRTGVRLRKKLTGAETLQLTGPGGTDLTVKIGDRAWRLSDGVIDEDDLRDGHRMERLPAGSISVAPLEDGAEGRVTFNVREPYKGRRMGRLTWTLRDGRVEEFEGDESCSKLLEEFEGAEGDKDRMSQLTIGFNPKATGGYNMNSVVSGAISVGMGSNKGLGGSNETDFYLHRTLKGGTLKADGRAIVKKGKIV
jgi:leucyl aminopeptidase (aminopeptidase T)